MPISKVVFLALMYTFAATFVILAIAHSLGWL